jgi:hypothetical protein
VIFAGVDCSEGQLLSDLRTTMEATLQGLPPAWVFMFKGAPVGKKAEGRRQAAEVLPCILVRSKAVGGSGSAATQQRKAAAAAAAAAAAPSAKVEPPPLVSAPNDVDGQRAEAAADGGGGEAGLEIVGEQGQPFGSVACVRGDTLAAAREVRACVRACVLFVWLAFCLC